MNFDITINYVIYDLVPKTQLCIDFFYYVRIRNDFTITSFNFKGKYNLT